MQRRPQGFYHDVADSVRRTRYPGQDPHLPPDHQSEHRWKLVFRGFAIASIVIGAGFALFILYVVLGGSAGPDYPGFTDRLSTYDSLVFLIPDAGVILGLFGLFSDRKRFAVIGIILCVIMGGFIFIA